MTSLFVLFVMLVVVGAEYPMIDSLQDKKFYIYPLSTDNWYAFPVSCTSGFCCFCY